MVLEEYKYLVKEKKKSIKKFGTEDTEIKIKSVLD